MTGAQFAKQFGINSLYHFTDSKNIQSINALGLLRLCELNRRGVKIPAAGGNEWSHDADERLGMDKYIHLCLDQNHPMLYHAQQDKRIETVYWISVDLSVMDLSNVRFSPGVSNKADVKPLTFVEAAEADLDFEVLFTRTNWKDASIQSRLKVARKYEILVPHDIPLKLLKKA